MKKIVIALLMIFMLFTSSTYADIVNTTQKGAYVLVNGNIGKEKEGVFVTLVVAKQGVTDDDITNSFVDSVNYIDQTLTDENGDYTFRIYFPDAFDAELIYIRSGEGKYRVAKKENVSYTAVGLVRSAIENINKAYYDNNEDSVRVQAMLAAISSEHLMLDKLSENTEYSELEDPSAVAKYLLDSVKKEKLVYDTDEELSGAVERVTSEWKLAVGISAVNESENQAKMTTIFNKYEDIFGIDPQRLNAITKGEYFCEQLKIFSPSTKEELKKAYQASCVFSDVNNTLSWSVLKEIFEDEYECLGVDMSSSGKYSKISNKTHFFKELSKSVPFTDLNDLVSDFDDLVNRLGKKQNSSSSGGGGGGGSSPGKTLSGVVSIPTSTNVNTNIVKKTFKDLKQTEWARGGIEYLLEKNIVNGVSEECFEPQRNVTRAEFLKMVIVAFGIKSEQTNGTFHDISSKDWYYEYVMIGKNAGIVAGDENGNFNPNINISRQDMAVMLYRCMKANNLENISVGFADSHNINAYALDAVHVLSKKKIINGYEDNTFRPAANATRAEAAMMIYGAIKGQ